ncbi:HAD family hydrolase [Paracoccus benzoatiresistens]|uniref:HAD family hydrolase n=1 Tax=Paracoccus benzoatiresistens TaxID=2997341 RepID=A0ABT4J5H1_9RHOB|nr:HAD family hydrolase [Paracoccus sp. EF6]MCZ0962359.1 HAD family hydrolase [Paracoccus sp. EF6]
MIFARFLLAGAMAIAGSPLLADPLPSWNDTDPKAALLTFVESVTDPASPEYVTPADRVAVFDNDGTLWAEQPVYFQFLYAMERIGELAESDPSILTSDTLKAAAEGNLEAALSGGEAALLEIVNVSHSGLSVDEFQDNVAGWLDTARHPVTGRPYRQMTYQPMLELLSYLRDEEFETYIVSGGGIHFVRAFAEEVYGIPPENVIGSAGKTRYAVIDDVPTILKDAGLAFIDDKEGKPVGIDTHIGKRPILVAGNSDGDFAMLEWATAGKGARLGVIVHHTDAAREWAYDRNSHVGQLARGLDEAPARGWLVVDMAQDWKSVWPGR